MACWIHECGTHGLTVLTGFQDGTSGKESACQCRGCQRRSSIPGLGSSPGGGNGNPLQYSCLGNPIDRGACWATVQGCKQSSMIEQAHTHNCIHTYRKGAGTTGNILAHLLYYCYVYKKISSCLLVWIMWHFIADILMLSFSCSVVSGFLWSPGQQHTRLPCHSPCPRACSNSCPLIVMSSNHLILCRLLLLLPSIFPSIRVFSNELALPIRWPKYWSFNFSISPSNEYSELISFRIDWFDLLAVQETLESSPAPQFESINYLVLSLLYGPALTSIYDYWKNNSFDYMDICWLTDASIL